MGQLELEVAVEKHRMAAPFRISGHVFEEADVVVVTVTDGAHRGRGEASGVYYTGDDVANIVRTIEDHRTMIEAGPSRDDLRTAMPLGGARNAVDCALWEIEADRSGSPVWALAGLDRPKRVVTTFTLGADDPAAMARGALNCAQARSLKLKLTGEPELDAERVRAVRAARPDAWIGVDANQGFAIDQLDALIAVLVDERIALLEQPLPRGREADLEGYRSPIPIAADESVLGLADIGALVGRFDVVNIKLDKCGGLTEGLLMAREARRLGLGVMVGNMGGTSLAMAPGFILAQLCDIVDLDGPTFLVQDRSPGLTYDNGHVWCGDDVWGRRTSITA